MNDTEYAAYRAKNRAEIQASLDKEARKPIWQKEQEQFDASQDALVMVYTVGSWLAVIGAIALYVAIR